MRTKLNNNGVPVVTLPLAEESGLIVQIGEWVIHQACHDLKKFDLALEDELNLSIKISTIQLQQPSFVSRVKDITYSQHIKPKRIQLEITENGLMENTKDAISTLHKLRGLGFSIAIDDFGTGYSSLSYLKQFPMNCLKLDKSFVNDLPRQRADRAIVSSTIKLGKYLGLIMIEEGVETAEAHRYLESIGCPYLQGFHFSKPLPTLEFIKKLELKEGMNIQ